MTYVVGNYDDLYKCRWICTNWLTWKRSWYDWNVSFEKCNFDPNNFKFCAVKKNYIHCFRKSSAFLLIDVFHFLYLFRFFRKLGNSCLIFSMQSKYFYKHPNSTKYSTNVFGLKLTSEIKWCCKKLGILAS